MNRQTEHIIVSLTTWAKRIHNIPTVLDTIFCQTRTPDLVVLNLNEDETVPKDVNEYLTSHNVELNRVPLKKVYKKLIPTLTKYPYDCIINIDDDWLYPSTMIEDFWNTHIKYPNNPISGNREFINGLPCHCGCASLTKASFFDVNNIDNDVMNNCPSDDTVFTFFAALHGHPYIWTDDLYYTNLKPYSQNDPYTESDLIFNAVGISWNYLTNRFGNTQSCIELLVHDPMVKKIMQKKSEFDRSNAFVQGQKNIRQTKSYKLGHYLLKPLSFFSLSKKMKHL